MLVMTGITVELPWPDLPQNLFAVLVGLVLIGGGAVMQMRGWACKTSGLLLLSLPPLSLLAGYAAMPGGMPVALAQLGSSVQLLLFVIGLTSLGIGFMALVTRRSSQSVELLAHRYHGQQQQLHDVVERVRAAEAHAVEAERRAQLAEHRLRTREANPWGASLPDDAAFAAAAKPGIPRSIWIVSALLVFSAALAALYAGLYRPLERRAAAQQAFVADAAREHAKEIDSLRKHFQAQQANLQALLAAEQGKLKPTTASAPRVALAPAAPSAAPPPAAVPAPAKAARVEVPAKPSVAAPAKTEAAPAKAETRSRRSSTRKSAAHRSSSRQDPPKPAAPRASEAKPAAAAPVNAEPKFDRETRKALREHMNDDPIGGLEGM
jgi:hypothetical protein